MLYCQNLLEPHLDYNQPPYNRLLYLYLFIPFSAIEKIMINAEEMKENRRLYHSSPVGVRFVKRSNAYMAVEYNRDVAYIDTPSLLWTRGTQTMLELCQQILFDKEGIPHWGISNSILDGRPEFLKATYPELDKLKEALTEFKPNGTFKNHFMERPGLCWDLPAFLCRLLSEMLSIENKSSAFHDDVCWICATLWGGVADNRMLASCLGDLLTWKWGKEISRKK